VTTGGKRADGWSDVLIFCGARRERGAHVKPKTDGRELRKAQAREGAVSLSCGRPAGAGRPSRAQARWRALKKKSML
jgi:hypothetical protein